jgi:hypothetical protein
LRGWWVSISLVEIFTQRGNFQDYTPYDHSIVQEEFRQIKLGIIPEYMGQLDFLSYFTFDLVTRSFQIALLLEVLRADEVAWIWNRAAICYL